MQGRVSYAENFWVSLEELAGRLQAEILLEHPKRFWSQRLCSPYAA